MGTGAGGIYEDAGTGGGVGIEDWKLMEVGGRLIEGLGMPVEREYGDEVGITGEEDGADGLAPCGADPNPVHIEGKDMVMD